jgi:uncharacterized protein YjdB
MERLLQRKSGFFSKKLPFLIALLVFSAGMSFSQTKKTVTSDADDGAGSLRQTITDAVDGDTIIFTGIDTIKLGEPLLLGDKTLVIDGENAISLDGRLLGTDADSNRVITVTGAADKTVTLLNMTIQHGYAKDTIIDGPSLDNGGGMLVDNQLGGVLIAEHCTFQNNMSVGRGGGVFAMGDVTFKNCTFQNDTSTSASNGDGGGAAVEYGGLFEDCTFTGNYAENQGGGLFIDTLCIVNNCTFDTNYAGDDGGGAKLNDPTNVLSNSTFTRNVSFDKGGGACTYGGTITVCHFESNTAGDQGGGLYLNGEESDTVISTVEGSTFTLNTAVDHGGGVFLNRGAAINIDANNNTTDEKGGGVYVNNYSYLKKSTISGNFCGDDGAGVFVDDPEGVVDSCTVTDNEATFDHGGGVYLDDGTLTNSTLSGNWCKDDGGGVFLRREGCLVENCIITGNEAEDHAGGAFINSGIVRNCVIDNNISGDDGGGVNIDNEPSEVHGQLIGCTVTNNSAVDQGGGVYVLEGDIINTTIVNNIAPNGGGVRGKGTWRVTNSIVYDNTSVDNDENNISINTNTSDVSVNFCAVDTTGHDLGAAVANTIQLDASPFVGGSGADSLHLPPASALIDAGTLTDTVAGGEAAADLLPATDLIGNLRVTGAGVDMGAFETFVTITGIDIVEDSTIVATGGTGELTVAFTPENPSEQGLEWTSGADTIVTVEEGTLTGVKEGGAYVYVVSVVNDAIMDSCWVTVMPIPVTGVELDQDTITMTDSGTGTLVASIIPANAGDLTVTWTSGNDAVATVADGVVSGVAVGETYVYVTTNDGGFKDTCTVIVTPTLVTGVSLDITTLSLALTKTETLVATVAPAEATDPSITWSSGNDAVATVADGVVTGVANGDTYIYVTTTDGGFKDSCAVNVYTLVTGVSLDQHTLTLFRDETGDLVATVAPADAADKTVSWTSANDAIATVADGTVTGVAGGDVYIYVTTTDGGFKDSCLVTVSTVGINDINATGIRIYPNPVSEGVMYIKLTDHRATSLEIYNTLGVLVHKELVNSRTIIELSAPQEKGIYFVKIIGQNNNYVERIIVQ